MARSEKKVGVGDKFQNRHSEPLPYGVAWNLCNTKTQYNAY